MMSNSFSSASHVSFECYCKWFTKQNYVPWELDINNLFGTMYDPFMAGWRECEQSMRKEQENRLGRKE